jgi:hypothetical protein
VEREGWERYALAESGVGFSYPPVTPQGQTVEKEEERADDHRGRIERVHLSSPDRHELYFEVIRFHDMSPREEYERHRPALERQFGAGAVTPLTETTFGERPAWAHGISKKDGQRSVLYLALGNDTVRIIWNPRSDLNAEILATLSVGET